MSLVTVIADDAPLLVTLPHTGTEMPADLVPRLVSRDLALKDTDWRIDDALRLRPRARRHDW